jgi:hypothetical protein
MNKCQVREALRKERAVAKRLVERRRLAQENLILSTNRIRELEDALKVAPEGWKGF